jgi:RNA polymerase sigma-70 factor (ECF subfamily)
MALRDNVRPKVPDTATERALLDGRGAFLGFLIKRLGNRADAEDVLQDFSIRVLQRKDQLRDAERMDAWLYAILRSTLNDHSAKARAVTNWPRRWRASRKTGPLMRRLRWHGSAPVMAV